MLKKGDWHERGLVTDQGHDRPGQPDKRGVKKLERRSSQRRSSECTTIGLCISRHDAAEVSSPEGRRHAEANPTCEVQEGLHVTLKFETKILRSDIFHQVNLMSVAPTLQNFEDRSQEETEWQEHGAREAAWKLAKSVLKLQEHERAAFFSLSENRCLPASTLKPEEREFVVGLRSVDADGSAKRTWVMLKWILWRNRAVPRQS